MITYPPRTLLARSPGDAGADVPDRSDAIMRTALAHKVGLTVEGRQVGATFTRYLLRLDPGTDPGKVERLMEAVSLSVEATARYTGRVGGTVGIEVPNPTRSPVTLGDVLAAGPAMHSLGFAAGLDVGGGAVMGHVARAPHILVAGSTGSGKSVMLNSLLVSLLLRHTPDELELVLVDPKRVELTPYADLPHLRRPVVSDVTEAAMALDDVVRLMDERYAAMEAAGARTLQRWNDLAPDGERWPYVVVVIDELADLMMTAGKVVEDKIARLGQLGRACGIHLVVATQRPSADIVTGKIKANIPARMALTVASGVDARVVGVPGAERLAGAGDALWQPNPGAAPIRLQTPQVTDAEIEAVVSWWRNEWPEEIELDEAPVLTVVTPEGVDQVEVEDVAWSGPRVVRRQQPAPARDLDREAKEALIAEMRARHDVTELTERVELLEQLLRTLLGLAPGQPLSDGRYIIDGAMRRIGGL